MENLKPFLDAVAPTSKSTLHSFVGSVRWFSKFVPGIHHHLAPFYPLLKKDSVFKWEEEHQMAFDRVKEALQKAVPLDFWHPAAQIILRTDASQQG